MSSLFGESSKVSFLGVPWFTADHRFPSERWVLDSSNPKDYIHLSDMTISQVMNASFTYRSISDPDVSLRGSIRIYSRLLHELCESHVITEFSWIYYVYTMEVQVQRLTQPPIMKQPLGTHSWAVPRLHVHGRHVFSRVRTLPLSEMDEVLTGILV